MSPTFRVPQPFLALAFLFCAAVQAGTYAATPAPLANAVAANANATATNARALFEQYWQKQPCDFPEETTELRDARYSDRLHDISPAEFAARKTARLGFLKKIDEIDPAQLHGEDRISWSVLNYNLKQEVVLDTLYGALPFSADDNTFAIMQMKDIHLQLPALLRAMLLKNVSDYTTLIARLDALSAHLARARKLPDLPRFRRAYSNSGCGEGWALYAESLGTDLRMYVTPYKRCGCLASEMFRAWRLVVDTGMHVFGMGRADAIAYMVEHAAITPAFATVEIDRYMVWPEQATAYKLGQLKIRALRDKAATKLGSKFDVRRFNNEIIDHGALSLDVMDEVTNGWITGAS